MLALAHVSATGVITSGFDGPRRWTERISIRTSTWPVAADNRSVYDGMLLIQERDVNNVPVVSYTRGLVLSGGISGAGGIDGLLGRSTHNASSPYAVNGSAFYHADGNGDGNITAMVNSAGALLANYKYDPYGRTLSACGSLAGANLMRISCKPMVLHSYASTDRALYYYGYRF